jgi:micrococcal nuclease
MNKRLIKSAVIFSLLLIPIRALAQNSLPIVVSVGDGDTLRVRSQGKTITIRLGCIDAPETKQQPWGEQSAARLKQILPPGTAAQVREIDLDYSSKSRVNVSASESSGVWGVDRVGSECSILSWFVVIGVKTGECGTACCIGNAPFLRAK